MEVLLASTIKAWMSLNVDHIHPPAEELAALERLKNRCLMLLAFLRLHFNIIFLILAGNEGSHSISDDAEMRLRILKLFLFNLARSRVVNLGTTTKLC